MTITQFGLGVLVGLAALGHARCVGAEEISKAKRPEIVGYTCVSLGYMAVPAGAKDMEVPNGSFESLSDGRPRGWTVGGMKGVVAGGARDGANHLEAPAGARVRLVSPSIPVEGVTPLLLSMWLRSSDPLGVRFFAEDAPSRFGRWSSRRLPSTNGEWRRVGVYFRMPEGTTRGQFRIWPTQQVKQGAVAIDDVRLRTATETEFSETYADWRTNYPKRDLTPRPEDGKHLALTIQKLQHGLDPERSFRVWAIGSSYTNMLGMGETLIQTIRARFPQAPAIVYKKHVGSSMTFDYMCGWAHHVVLPDPPDLVLIYTIGRPEDLDRLIGILRSHSTADIIVPSIHWRMRDKRNWGKSEDAADQNVAAIRAVCTKHGVEFVESRREWAEFMAAQGMEVEIDKERGLLKDAVHQSDYGALIINENIGRHFAVCAQPAYDPAERERRLAAAGGKSIRQGERVERTGRWRVAGGVLRTSAKGARIKVTFQGNRVDLIARHAAGGGTADVLIDGKPAGQAEAFFRTYIQPGPKNAKPKRGMASDQCPHGVFLGKDIVPQRWVITMTDDRGHYKLVGSVTGPDGKGRSTEPFTSDSGQIVVPPKLWRRAKGRDGKYSNKTGDTFTFDVVRSAVGEVPFASESSSRFREKLVQNMDNRVHTLELVARGDGPIAVEAFDVFEPPE